MDAKTGSLWDAWADADLCLLAGHSTVRGGKLVMAGDGLKEAQRRFPTLPEAFGQAILKKAERQQNGRLDYFLLVSDHWPTAKLGLFQTRHAAADPPDLQVVTTSVLDLVLWMANHEQATVQLDTSPALLEMIEGMVRKIPRLTLWVHERTGVK